MPVSVTLPDELAGELRRHQDNLPEILSLGLREWHARIDQGFGGLRTVLETLASLPTPQDVLALRPAPGVQARIEELLEKNRASGLSPAEQREWESYEFVEHLVRLAKAQARIKLQAAGG